MSKVQDFLNKQDKIIQEDREKTLLSLGLSEREYAPDGKRSPTYDKVGWRDGHEDYYREVAIDVTDEEWAAILDKVRQVEDIRRREELAREQEEQRRTRGAAKKWLPIFQKPAETTPDGEKKPIEPDTGRSTVAFLLRLLGWVIAAVMTVAGGIMSFEAGEPVPLFFALPCAGVELLILYALAEALDHLCEIAAILRNGFRQGK